MTKYFEYVERQLLTPHALDLQQLGDVASVLALPEIDGGELFFQGRCAESLGLENGILNHSQVSMDAGIGLRAFKGPTVGYAYTQDLRQAALLDAAKQAGCIAQNSQVSQRIQVSERSVDLMRYYAMDNPLEHYSMARREALLRALESYARALDERIVQVFSQVSLSHSTVFILNLGGEHCTDVRPMVHVSLQVVLSDGKRQEVGQTSRGARLGDSRFLTDDLMKVMAEEAVHKAQENWRAESAPAGQYSVLLGPGWPAVLLHEAVGHGLEGDFNRKGTSIYSQRIGQSVASDLCTVIDDGTIDNRRGSLSVDDEGTPTQRTVLIEKGILKGYLQDKRNAHLMGDVSTGNGRRESYASPPMPRMTNTFLMAGDRSPESLLSQMDDGIWAVDFSGGQVDITSGNFVFETSLAYRVKKGKVVAPVKGVTLIGNGPDVMHKIIGLGNDWSLDKGCGVCGKSGQSVPVGVGQPSTLISAMTVGGTSHD